MSTKRKGSNNKEVVSLADRKEFLIYCIPLLCLFRLIGSYINTLILFIVKRESNSVNTQRYGYT